MASFNVDRGKLYHVEIRGPDLYGYFISRLILIEKIGEGPVFEFTFDNGITITNRADCIVTEVQEGLGKRNDKI